MQSRTYQDLRIPEKKFRPEIEGVRVVASFLVAIYHIWLGAVSGGVDVFFVVSGYLITTSLLTRFERNGHIKYFSYLLNLGKRLFPQAFVVLVFTAIGSFLFLPQVQWKQIIAEIYASAFYFENWQLANNAVDYLARDNEVSPLQHFWAMSLQGQFYLTWPLIIFIAFLIARKLLKTPFRKTLLGVLILVFTLSISYSVYITTVNQPWAYFDTFARAWEFSIGGILALLIPYLRFNKLTSFILGWLGLAIILFTGILLPVSTVFPGYAALLPISGVLFIIIAAENGSMLGVDKLLGSKPFVYFGNFSYGFYLWHWPILIFYLSIFQKENTPIFDGIVILIISLILSILSTKIVEAPVRDLSIKTDKKKIAFILILFLLPVIGVNSGWTYYIDKTEEEFRQQVNIDDYPGARVLYDNVTAREGLDPIMQHPDESSSLPSYYEDQCYTRLDEDGIKVCSYGNTENPDYTVALVGGSRTGHWMPAIEEFAEELNLQLDIYNKDTCRFSTDDFDGLLTESCLEWNKLALEKLMENPPDFIFTTANVNIEPTIPIGYLEIFKKFEGITNFIAIRNNPNMSEDPPICVETKGADNCKVLRENVLAETPPWENTDDLPNNVYFVDMSDYFCDDEYCYPVIGNVLAYRDRYHISSFYAMTLAEPLKEHFIKAIEIFEN